MAHNSSNGHSCILLSNGCKEKINTGRHLAQERKPFCMSHYKILQHKLYTLGSKHVGCGHSKLKMLTSVKMLKTICTQKLTNQATLAWSNLNEFLACRNASRITHFNYHSTKEIRKRLTQDQSLFDVWKNIKLVVLRSNQHMTMMQANQWVLNQSQTSLCVVQQMRKKLQNDMPYQAHLHTHITKFYNTRTFQKNLISPYT